MFLSGRLTKGVVWQRAMTGAAVVEAPLDDGRTQF
jgi:hypothetical protein